MRWRNGASISLLAFASIAHAAPPTTSPSDLIQQLADPATAKDATEQLINLGEAARPALQDTIKSRRAVQETMARIESAAALAPTRITLKLDNVPVENILTALGKQAGCIIRPYNKSMWNNRANKGTLSVDYRDMPWWDVINDLDDRAQIAPYLNAGNSRALQFMPAGMMGPSVLSCPRSTHGSVIVLLTGLNREKSVSLGTNATHDSNFSGELNLLFEPRVRVMNYANPATVLEAIDNHGNSLVGDPEGGGTSSGSNGLMITSQLRLKYPTTNPGDRIAKLRGAVNLRVVTGAERLVFDNTAVEKTLRQSTGRQITLNEVTRQPGDNNRQYIAKLTIVEDQPIENIWDFINGVSPKMLDANGQELQFQGTNENNTTGNTAHISLMYFRPNADEGGDDAGEPAKMVWDIPTKSQSVDVPFEFKDLPMP